MASLIERCKTHSIIYTIVCLQSLRAANRFNLIDSIAVGLFQLAWPYRVTTSPRIRPRMDTNEHEKRATADEHGCTQIKHRKTGEPVLEKSICVYLQPARHSFSDGRLICSWTSRLCSRPAAP